MPRRSLAAVCLFAASLAAFGAPAGAPETVLRSGQQPMLRYALENGLQVLLQEDHGLPLVTVSVLYAVGAADEPEGRTGLAHLCEHLMFRGSQHTRVSHQGILSEVGAIHHNGSTSFHQTSYFETVPRGNLQTALWLESDRMGFLTGALDEDKLRGEREVVKNERRQIFETAPYGVAEERLWQALFPRPHPYSGMVIGAMADLDAITLADVRAFFLRHYVPRNATLALVGDFDTAAAQKLVLKYFATLPDRPRPSPTEPPLLVLPREVQIQHRERIATLPKLVLAWHSPPLHAPEDRAAAILAALLAASPASRLPLRLGGLVTQVTASQDSLQAQSVFKIAALGRPGMDPRRILREIDGVLDEIRQGGVTEAEVARAELRLRTSTLLEMQDTAQKLRRLQLGRSEEGPLWPAEGLARYQKVRPEDVQRLVRGVLSPGRRVVLYAIPD